MYCIIFLAILTMLSARKFLLAPDVNLLLRISSYDWFFSCNGVQGRVVLYGFSLIASELYRADSLIFEASAASAS